MLKNLVSDLQQYASIAIFGYGVEGKSFERFAQKYLPKAEIIIVDRGESQSDAYLQGLEKAELIIKSPGISLYNLGIDYNKYNFTSITELFLKHFSSQIIGVSGTKGKSTLVSIIDKLLKNAGKKSVLCGNIGLSPLDALEGIDAETTIVMELSSHQLHHIAYSPHIAILTNLFEEHLDYYKDLQDYYSAKFNIFSHQKKDDIFIFNLQEPRDYIKPALIKTQHYYNVHASELKNEVAFNLKNGYIHKATLQILEKLVEILNIDKAIYLKTITEFKTLPHRLEYVAEIDGVRFINDSISTIPEATMEAVKILKEVDTVIIGGNDRGVHYDALVDFLLCSGVENIILFSNTGKQIYEKLQKQKSPKNIFYMKNLRESVEKAYENAQSIVLFSPAASSFNEYKNFVERGEEFKSFVKSLKR
jgi:UDP-N-acetylmuramoylalanine--D-glutamate ligase